MHNVEAVALLRGARRTCGLLLVLANGSSSSNSRTTIINDIISIMFIKSISN